MPLCHLRLHRLYILLGMNSHPGIHVNILHCLRLQPIRRGPGHVVSFLVFTTSVKPLASYNVRALLSLWILFLFLVAACPVCYLPLKDAIALMPNASSVSPVIRDLTYIHEENLTKSEFGGSEFGGYPSLRQRSDSYDIRESMNIHCGYDSFFFGSFGVTL